MIVGDEIVFSFFVLVDCDGFVRWCTQSLRAEANTDACENSALSRLLVISGERYLLAIIFVLLLLPCDCEMFEKLSELLVCGILWGGDSLFVGA